MPKTVFHSPHIVQASKHRASIQKNIGFVMLNGVQSAECDSRACKPVVVGFEPHK